MAAKKKPAKPQTRTNQSLGELIADSEHLRKRAATLMAELKQLASDVAENRATIRDQIERGNWTTEKAQPTLPKTFI